jgi:hypothetical protein
MATRSKQRKIAGRTIAEWGKLSAEMDREMAGAPENTEPLTAEERRWYRAALADLLLVPKLQLGNGSAEAPASRRQSTGPGK